MEVETVKGGLGEFSVYMDGRKVIDTNRLWYPTTSKMVKKDQGSACRVNLFSRTAADQPVPTHASSSIAISEMKLN